MSAFYTTRIPDEPVDDVVIGSGMGGMILARILSRQGRRVCVLEQHYVPGGVTHSFNRPSHQFNVGVHVLGDVSPLSINGAILSDLCDPPPVWDSLGEYYDRVEFSDEVFEVPATEEGLCTALKARFTDEHEAIDKYFELIHRAAFDSVLHFIYKCLPWHGRLCTWPWLRRPSRGLTLSTTEEVIAGLTQDPKLQRILTAQWGYHGTPPTESSFIAHAQVTAHFFKGGFYPRGGGPIFAERLLRPLVEREGGSVSIRTPVEQILFSRKKAVGVRLKGGRVIRAQRVFSNAGAHATAQLVSEAPHFEAWRKEVLGFPCTSGHVALFVGFDRPAADLGIDAKNLWVYGASSNGLRSVDELPYPTDSFEPAGFWFSFSSEKDRNHDTLRFGHCAQLITFVPNDWFVEHFQKKRGKRGAEYDALKSKIQAGLLAALERRFPGISQHVVHAELSTPASTYTFTARPRGSIYGLATIPARFWSLSFGTRTPSPNVFLTGSDAAMVGVMGALAGGLLAAFTASPWRTIFYLVRVFQNARKNLQKKSKLRGALEPEA